MPSGPRGYGYCNLEWAKRRKAWERHYMAKGANSNKARQAAERKRHKSTWPPKEIAA